ncbi:MAG: flagellar basal-body MS-ring/collar protein FliF, partial [Gammaproteobacteria bacterium]
METQTPAATNLAGLFRSQPAFRQVVLLLGLAASITVGIAGAMWLRQPEFSALYSNLSDGEASEVVQALGTAGIEYEVDQLTGSVRVKPAQLYEARMTLASAGLPRGSGAGFEMLQQESGITSSQFMENARYHNALETELARTISNLRPVQSARVHLALPRTTVFLRERESPSASVLVHLFPGRVLEAAQVSSIVNLVASSIPELESSKVTVVDQNGLLLTDTSGTDD